MVRGGEPSAFNRKRPGAKTPGRTQRGPGLLKPRQRKPRQLKPEKQKRKRQRVEEEAVKTLIVIPAYNEEGNIINTLEDLKRELGM